MNDKDLILSQCQDRINSAVDNSMITRTDFLSVEERADVMMIERKYSSMVDFLFFGGYDEAERTVCLFIPSYFGFCGDSSDFLESYSDSNPLSVIKITKDKFTQISHRDYLGAIMGLGVKRKTIGDIMVFDWGAYVITLNNISNYICENLRQCGRAAVKCSVCDLASIVLSEEKTETVFHSVASMRLDNILSAGFGISRAGCTEAISAGLVFVNSVRAEKKDMQIKENDKIVLRGKGKVIIENIIGKSKKDRIHINIRHYK